MITARRRQARRANAGLLFVSSLCVLALVAVGGIVGAAAAHAGPRTRPAVTGLSRHHGPYWGATKITVRGRNFDNATKVLFEKESGWGLNVVSSTKLTVFTPYHGYGTVHVRVVTPKGISLRGVRNRFTFTRPTMTTPIMGGLTARQEQRISARVRATHRGVHIAPWRNHWTPAMGSTAKNRARSWLGLPYSWAGGNGRGPTFGVCAHNGGDMDCHVVGFDCSGLSLYAWSPYEPLIHFAATQHRQAGRFHPSIGQLMPGDLVFFSADDPNGIGHVAIYAGRGRVIQASQSGTTINRARLLDVIAYSGIYRGATRPMSTGRQGPGARVLRFTSHVSTKGGYVRITGRHLFGATAVYVGGKFVYRFVKRMHRHLIVRVPAHAAGKVQLKVSNAWGTADRKLVYVAPGTGTTRAAPSVPTTPRSTSPTTSGPPVIKQAGNRFFEDRVGVDWYLVGRLAVGGTQSPARACLKRDPGLLTHCLERAAN